MYFSTESLVEKPVLVGQPTKKGLYLVAGSSATKKRAQFY
tara:strand:- start:249 stop:368 length:120 start_codon:yes stop_codon:yes gene_type:complete